ncbi:MAG TPA: NAD-dependent epimerase/dehydratase family protein [Gaiellaceae bacterium]|nr:NAD-dependent epimerase/dehydratase family protein [Gaiellaceae bacterium]
MSGRRILVTGGAGFVGLHLTRRLAAEEADSIVLLDDFSRGRRDDDLDDLLRLPNVDLVAGDVCEPATWGALDGGFDEVYHLAAIIGVRHVLERPHEVVRVNALSTLLLLDWLVRGGGEKVLFSSTSEAYAWTRRFHELPMPTPEDVPLSLTDLADPRSSYAGSKIFGELAVTQWCQTHGKPFVIVRYHNVYGPRMGSEHVIPELFQRALSGQNPLVVYSADHRRAFCYVSDAVEATVAAMRTPAAEGTTFNIGNDREEITIGELAERLLEHAHISVALSPQDAPNDPVSRRSPDLGRARRLLGYEPRVPLSEGLAKTLSWYAERLSLQPS